MDHTNPQDIQALVQELQLARNQIQTAVSYTHLTLPTKA